MNKPLSKQINVEFGWFEIAHAIAAANSQEQREFLEYLSRAIDLHMPLAKWDFQCRGITDDDGWHESNRTRLIDQLESLLAHLKDPKRQREQL